VRMREIRETFERLFSPSVVRSLSLNERYLYVREYILHYALLSREDENAMIYTPLKVYELIEDLFPTSLSLPLLRKLQKISPTTATFHNHFDNLYRWESVDTWLGMFPRFSHHWDLPIGDIAIKVVDVVGHLQGIWVSENPAEIYFSINSHHTGDGNIRNMGVSIRGDMISEEDIYIRVRVYEGFLMHWKKYYC
jgi:hypothetical protein